MDVQLRPVIPAKAGIQSACLKKASDFRLHGNDIGDSFNLFAKPQICACTQ